MMGDKIPLIQNEYLVNKCSDNPVSDPMYDNNPVYIDRIKFPINIDFRKSFKLRETPIVAPVSILAEKKCKS